MSINPTLTSAASKVYPQDWMIFPSDDDSPTPSLSPVKLEDVTQTPQTLSPMKETAALVPSPLPIPPFPSALQIKIKEIVFEVIQFCERHDLRRLEKEQQSIQWPRGCTSGLWDPECDPFVSTSLNKRPFERKIRAWRRSLNLVEYTPELVFVPPSPLIGRFALLQEQASALAAQCSSQRSIRPKESEQYSLIQKVTKQEALEARQCQRQKQLLFGMATPAFKKYGEYLLRTGNHEPLPLPAMKVHLPHNRELLDLIEKARQVELDIIQLDTIFNRVNNFLIKNVRSWQNPISNDQRPEEILLSWGEFLLCLNIQPSPPDLNHHLVRKFNRLLEKAKPVVQRFHSLATDRPPGAPDDYRARSEVVRIQALTLRYLLIPRSMWYCEQRLASLSV